MQLLNPVLRVKNLAWDLNIPENIEIVCDMDKLERAVDNLIRNAINYSFPDTSIQFTLVPLAGSVQICIQNQGNPIPPEKLERIFEQFYRLDAARSSDTGGAGLGLAIAKEIVELHHGIITAYSADKLIRFTIQLPLDCQKIL
ncbi:GHKL domain-containing protein [Pseudoflavonifractor sp. 60]|nr:GHKL domain-containing protein [Pseudoflavonifractor sp. 60]